MVTASAPLSVYSGEPFGVASAQQRFKGDGVWWRLMESKECQPDARQGDDVEDDDVADDVVDDSCSSVGTQCSTSPNKACEESRHGQSSPDLLVHSIGAMLSQLAYGLRSNVLPNPQTPQPSKP